MFFHLIAQTLSYLLAVRASVPHPLAQLGAPVLEHVGLRVLHALPVAEAALRARGRDHVHRAQVHLQPLRRLRGDLRLGAPRAALDLLVQPGSNKERNFNLK